MNTLVSEHNLVDFVVSATFHNVLKLESLAADCRIGSTLLVLSWSQAAAQLTPTQLQLS